MSNRDFVFLIALGGLLAVLGLQAWQNHLSTVNKAREQRVTSVVQSAPATLPSELPLIGASGSDADGYPLMAVDRAALRSLLWHGKYRELNAYVEELQNRMERDWHTEYWIVDAAEALGTGEKEILPELDAWVAATPGQFAPYLARGYDWVNAGYSLRGTKFVRETAGVDLAAMRKAFAKGQADLDRAIKLHPKLVAALREKIKVHVALGEGNERDGAVQAAQLACPHCMQHRVTYMLGLRPRWGGSYKWMEQLAVRARDGENPRTRFLAGYADLDRAEVLRSKKEYDDALFMVQRACALGEYWPFLLARAQIRESREEWSLAQADLDRALTLRPGMPELLFERARTELNARTWEAAGTDLLAGLRVDPADADGRRLLGKVTQGVIYQGWQYHQVGRREDALRLFDLAAELEPGNREVQARRASIVAGSESKTQERVAKLEQQARAAPDDFRSAQQLDYAWAAQGKFEQVVTMWSEFISHHPDDARAHLERGGAYFHWGKRQEALADARRACELGLNEGCLRAQQLGGR